jgi:hypothetical protein
VRATVTSSGSWTADYVAILPGLYVVVLCISDAALWTVDFRTFRPGVTV